MARSTWRQALNLSSFGDHPVLATACVVAFLVVAILTTVRVVAVMNEPGEIDSARWAFVDFRDAVYYPTRAFLNGDSPYQTDEFQEKYPVGVPFSPYSPLFLLVHSPLGMMPHAVAQLVYFGLSVLLTVVCAAVALRMCGVDRSLTLVLGLGALILVSRPGHFCLTLGQTTLEFVIAAYAALFLAASRPWLAGAALAFAVMKPSIGVPLAMVMLVGGLWRSVAAGAVVTVAATLIPSLILAGPSGGLVGLVRDMFNNYQRVLSFDPSVHITRIDAVAFFSRLYGERLGFFWHLTILLIVVVSAGIAIGRVRRLSFSDRGGVLFGMSVACLAVLLATYQNAYSALLLVAPLTALVVGRWSPSRLEPPRWTRAVLFLLLATPFVNFLGSWRFLHYFETGSWIWLVVTSVNGAALIGAFCIYLWLALGRRHWNHEETRVF